MSAQTSSQPVALSAQDAERFTLAKECFGRGEHARATALLEALLQGNPGFARGWFLLGYTEGVRGRFDAAVAPLERAVELAQDDAECRYYLAKAYASAGRRSEAVRELQETLARAPEHGGAHLDLGLNLQALGDIDAAVPHLEQAVRLAPQSAQAHSALGMALRETQRLEAAEEALRSACRIDPGDATARLNLGLVLKRRGHWDAAIEAMRESVARAPQNRKALNALGITLARAGRGAQAIEVLRQAHEKDPAHAGVLGWLIREQELVCEWAGLEELTQAARALLLEQGRSIHPFVWLSRTGSGREQRMGAALWAQSLRPRQARREGPRPASRAGGRIRVAYLSADFHEHAMAQLMAGVFERHDRARFEVTAVSLGAGRDDAMRARLVRGFERFVDASGKSDQEVVRLIEDLGIDIAVDLMGYTKNSRTAILARRPAPVQVNYLGYPGTMGADYIDYIIADAFLIPRAAQAHYAEKIVTLPDCFQGNDAKREIGATTLTRSAAGLPEDGVVFCCFNSPYKLNPAMFDVWMRILARTPRSVLWLLGERDALLRNLRQAAQRRGVDPARRVFAARTRTQDYLARYRLADLFLDTLPFNGGATASDALWAGLPVLTCAGEVYAARMAGSLLRAVGLPELVTERLADYEARALELAADAALLRETQAKLARNRHREPLFDTERFTRNLEAAYAAMWEIRQSGEAPRHIDVRAAPARG
jgi:protein O-GlcNAc transferase